MSVYTWINRSELESFLKNYALGALVDYKGIADGIENTNYSVVTSKSELVLTVFEHFTHADLGYFLQLLEFLQTCHFPSPEPQADLQGSFVNELENKPAIFFKRIKGSAVSVPSRQECAQVGHYLALLHRSGANFKTPRKNPLDLSWCQDVSEKLRAHLQTADYALIKAELEFQTAYSHVQLPQGLIHGDLFKDNVLFFDGKISGILDFYNACCDSLLLDLAITANDWCHEEGGRINWEKLECLINAYQQQRVLAPIETELLPVLLRAAALRFWLSRLEHQLFKPEGEMIQDKDPLVYRAILRQHQQHSINLTGF